MGITDRKAKITKIRQEDIINAAEKVFFSKGLTNSTMDDIAKEAQYSKRTLYMYFSSKEQLYDAIVLRAYQILNRYYEQVFKDSHPKNGLEKIILMGKTYLDFIGQYPQHFEAMIYYENRDVDLVSQDQFKKANYQAGNTGTDLLIGCIKEGIADGSIYPEFDPVSTAFTLYANIIGIGTIILKKEKYIAYTYQKNITELIEEMFRVIVRGLKP
jgi:AcrR family transcriptional regulator